MATWSEVVEQAPELAAEVEARFRAAKHATMATLRADGAPRISGTEVEVVAGQVEVGVMAGAVKARDLRRDPRCALHSPTVDPPQDDPSGWPGEAKLAGRAVEVTGPAAPADGSSRFRLEVTEVVLTRVGSPPDHLLVTSWHPGRGVEVVRRS
jgi:hypothetical protein